MNTLSDSKEAQVAEVLHAEQQLRLAVLSGDVIRLEELLADELLFVSPSGQLLSKEMDLEAHRSGQLQVHHLEIVEQDTRVIGEGGDVVLTFSLVSLAGTFAGEAFEGHFRYTRVWRRNAHGWCIAGGHCSAVEMAA
jgi:ketosteroid isomerase-like protein